MSVRWKDLTPQAQQVMTDELKRYLARAPDQPVVRLAWDAAMRDPRLIPSMLERVKELTDRQSVQPIPEGGSDE